MSGQHVCFLFQGLNLITSFTTEKKTKTHQPPKIKPLINCEIKICYESPVFLLFEDRSS